MESYFLSVDDKELKAHPEYPRIIQPGEATIFENRHNPNRCVSFGVLGDDSRRYFRSMPEELAQVTKFLISGMPEQSTVRIQKATRENLPANLKRLADNLADWVEKNKPKH
jgi:hypothetical protein